MQKVSAGILLYSFINGEIHFFLVHPGGPYFRTKDNGSWTIPKGEPNSNEDLIECALREFSEETGVSLNEPLIELTPVRQKGGKTVHAWACHKFIPTEHFISNSFELEWPPHSGRMQQFPEIDRAEWFVISVAEEKINPAQRSFLSEVLNKVMPLH